MDLYKNFQELRAANTEWVDFEIAWIDRSDRSKLCLMAPHGGSIEPWTDILARKVADILGASFYAFTGKNFDLHLTSSNFDEPIAVALVAKHDIVCTIHGCRWAKDIVHVGGVNEALRNQLITALRSSDIPTSDFSENPFPWISERNICNRWRLWGVQVEISTSLRDRLRQDERVMENFSRIISETLRANM